jgi:zinc/manganese transport system ATP-binding protein
MLHPRPHGPGHGGLRVELDGVYAGYRDGPVLEDARVAIEPGDFVGIVGPSGSGKSTFLRTILGDTHVFDGSVRVDGRAPDPATQAIGYVPQIETVDWNFPVTAREVVLMAVADRRWRPWPGRRARAEAEAILDRLGIGELADRHIRQLSGGQQQRVFLARALARRPSLLLLDEPTSGVDLRTRDEILHLLDELNHQGITMVMTTHELNAVAAHLPRVICLNGRVIADGSPLEVFTGEVLAETYGAEVPVLEYEGMRLVAERPHLIGVRNHAAGHPAGDAAALDASLDAEEASEVAGDA